MSKIVEHNDVRPLLNLNREEEKWELYLIRNKSYKVIADDLDQYMIDNVRKDFAKGAYEFKIGAEFNPDNNKLKIGYCKYSGINEWEYTEINTEYTKAGWIEDENKIAYLFFNVFCRYFDKPYTSAEEARNEEKIEKLLSVNYYKDNAHFIYELMQNADDAEAKNIYFELYSDKIVIHHDGKKRFDISQPSYYYDENKDEDMTKNELAESGCVNAISLVMQSNKKGKDTIGRFGIGFKSVYAFTKKPLICDGALCFKLRGILRGIEVVELSGEYKKWVNNHETVFELPFNLERRPAAQCVGEIIKQFEKLKHPTLFLRSLNNVYLRNHTIETGKYSEWCYSLSRSTVLNNELLKIEKITYNDATDVERYLYVSSTGVKAPDSNGIKTIELAFAVNKETGAITSLEENEQIYCYFPTKEESKLGFLIHAPFLLTENREKIERVEEYNVFLINQLAKLACQTIEALCKIHAIDDEILKVVTYSRDEKRDNIQDVFYNKFLTAFVTKPIIPTGNKGKYVTAEFAFWSTPIYRNIFKDMLPQNSFWCFTSILKPDTQNPKFSFVNKILGKKCWSTPEKFITSEFCEILNIETLTNLYQVILENNLIEDYKLIPIWRTQKNRHVAAYKTEENEKIRNTPMLFRPTLNENSDSVDFVHESFLHVDPAIYLMDRMQILSRTQEDEQIEAIKQDIFTEKRYSTNQHLCNVSIADEEHLEDWKRITGVTNWKKVFAKDLDLYHIFAYKRFSDETGYCSRLGINCKPELDYPHLLSYLNVDVKFWNKNLYMALGDKICAEISSLFRNQTTFNCIQTGKQLLSLNRNNTEDLALDKYISEYRWTIRHREPNYIRFHTLVVSIKKGKKEEYISLIPRLLKKFAYNSNASEKEQFKISRLFFSVISTIKERDITLLKEQAVIDWLGKRDNETGLPRVDNPIMLALRKEPWLIINGNPVAPCNVKAYQLRDAGYPDISSPLLEFLGIQGDYSDMPNDIDFWKQKYEEVQQSLNFEGEEDWKISTDGQHNITYTESGASVTRNRHGHKGGQSSGAGSSNSDTSEKILETESPAQFQPALARRLLGQSISILGKLKDAKLLRTSNTPTGEYSEWLISTALKLKLLKVCNKGFDAIDDKERIQIKGLRMPYCGVESEIDSLQLSAVRSLDDFDSLICVVFSYYFEYIRLVIKVSRSEIQRLVTERKKEKNGYTNSYIFHVGDLFQCKHEILTDDVVNALKQIDA